jgi:hypothetical protein
MIANKSKLFITIFLAINFFVFGVSVLNAQSGFTPADVDAYIREYGFDGELPTDPQARYIGEIIREFISKDNDLKSYSPEDLEELYNKNTDFRNFFLNNSSKVVDDVSTSPTYNPTSRAASAPGSNDPTKENFQLVPADCYGTGNTAVKTIKDAGGCGWKDLIYLLNTAIKFMIYIAASLSAIAFAYAGFLYMTAFGQSGKIEQAHGIFSKTITGIFFVLIGWLLVATILKVLGVPNAFSLLNMTGVTSINP